MPESAICANRGTTGRRLRRCPVWHLDLAAVARRHADAPGGVATLPPKAVGHTEPVKRHVSARLDVTVLATTRMAIQIGVANPGAHQVSERIEITVDDEHVKWQELPSAYGGRIWLLDSGPGALVMDYDATVSGSMPAEAAAIDELTYLRPSRYCESDRLVGFAQRHFHDISGAHDILAAVSSWVGTQLEYVSGSSGPTDGAIDTLLAARGVCRDYAHLAVALLRALQVPARLVSVYAPGLDPMDFHAVAEALIDGCWYVIDGTLLAPRSSLVRIATGRDAADTAFLSNYGGNLTLDGISVTATVEGELPRDDVSRLVQLD
jgi:transglutaminase-like putative cysteine protease